MKKSFKKAIAVLLAVLMAAFSVPFTAFAAPGDYNPDMDVMFGTFHHSESATWTDYTTGSGKDYSMCGIFDVPVDFNSTLSADKLTKSGTLYIDKNKAAKAAEVLGYEALTEDYTLGVGDYFTCSVIMKNATTIGACMAAIQFSDNIEPAGYYSYKSGRTTKYEVGTVADCEAKGGTFAFGGNTPIAAMSSEGIYGMNVGATGNATTIVTDADGVSYMLDAESCQNGGNYIDVSKSYNEYYANPETGELTGYTYNGTAILETFVFKITGEGDIAFSVYDPYNTKRNVFEGGYMIADGADGYMLDDYTTYAINNCDANNDPVPGGPENPGSCKMTFFGANANVQSAECTHANAVKTEAKAATCTEAGNTEYWTCPDCSKLFSDAAFTTETTADAVVVAALNHKNAVKTEAKPATCTDAGNTEYWTCPDCGKLFSDAAFTTETTADAVVVPANGHTPVSADNAKAPTCTEAGKEADTVCSVCGITLEEGAVINPTNHTYGDWAPAGTNTEGKYIHTRSCTAGDDTQTAECTFGAMETITPATPTSEGTGKYTCTACGQSYEVTIGKTDCAHADLTKTAEVPATCTDKGTEAYWTCNTCGKLFSDEAATTEITAPVAIPEKGHTEASADNAKEATCTEAGKEADTVCSVCGVTLAEGAVIEAKGHTEVSANNAKEATCTEAGKEADTVCSVCGATIKEGAVIEAKGHTEVSADNAKEATCTEAGKEADTVCSVCGATIKEGAVIEAKGHTPVSADNAKEATCTEAGKEADTICSVCKVTLTEGAVIEAKGHTPVSADNAVAPTVDAAGKEADTVCSVCGITLEEGAVIPALEGVEITVVANDLGTTAINDTDSTNGATVKVVKNSNVTLTATPVEGAEFVGWRLDNKIASTNATYTTVALSNATYTPVFTETADAQFTVVFVDNYGNVIDTQTVASAADIVAPTAPARVGYTFTGWSEDYTTLTAGATIYAQYTKDAAAAYTVIADGCTITTAAGESATDKLENVAYDTKVTITANDNTASSWKIGDATVAYGESYTFYVGSDVTVVPQFDATVTAVPTVSIVNVSDVTTDIKRAVFLATRSMTDDCTLVANGFVYGKDVATDITLDDVNGRTVKRLQSSTASDQFSITFGAKAQRGKLVARPYLTYKTADGVVTTIYAENSDNYTYTY